MTIVFQNVGLEWPNGKTVLHNISFSLEQKIYGLIGPNGVGKTTLASLLTGELEVTSGSLIRGSERVFCFQQKENPPDISIAEYLMGTDVFEEPRLLSFLKDLPLEQICSSLSGGEWARVRLVKVAASGASFVILDEPTNHMDQEGRDAIYDFLDFFQGGILIISHDREILEEVDQILELSNQGLSLFSGGFREYSTWRDQERERLKNHLDEAKKNRVSAEVERQEKLEKQAKRQAKGRRDGLKGGIPKILLGGRKRRAEVTAGEIDKGTMKKMNEAVEDAWEAYQKLKIDPVMFAELPEVHLPQGKMILRQETLILSFRRARRIYGREI